MESVDPRRCYDYLIAHRGENPQLTNTDSVADCAMTNSWTFYGGGSAVNEMTFTAKRSFPSITYLAPWQASPVTLASGASRHIYVPRSTNCLNVGTVSAPAAEVVWTTPTWKPERSRSSVTKW